MLKASIDPVQLPLTYKVKVRLLWKADAATIVPVTVI